MEYGEYGEYGDYPDYPDTFGWDGELVAVPGFGFLPPRMEEVLEAEAQVGDSSLLLIAALLAHILHTHEGGYTLSYHVICLFTDPFYSRTS